MGKVEASTVVVPPAAAAATEPSYYGWISDANFLKVQVICMSIGWTMLGVAAYWWIKSRTV